MKHHYEAVVVGVSAGGFKALRVFLSSLHTTLPAPIIIVQHRMASPDNYLVTYLDSRCHHTVKEAEEKECIKEGIIYIAPADYHLLVEKDKTFSLSVDEFVCFARPSVDVLFETAAAAYKEKLVAIILTGANSDGSAGMRNVKAQGGLTITQDPDTAESPIMPLAAIATNSVDFILELEDIPLFLKDLLEAEHDIQD